LFSPKFENCDFTPLGSTEATTTTLGSSVGRLMQSSVTFRGAAVESFGLETSLDFSARL
jgi:hypothetical protein